mmetsp:Transcript_34924/g.84483  ORF Transcript_34924/g.84483 Transcript_34924/m.84483 type:complete len:117 (+) Transcript_34924:1247-1597(+)
MGCGVIDFFQPAPLVKKVREQFRLIFGSGGGYDFAVGGRLEMWRHNVRQPGQVCQVDRSIRVVDLSISSSGLSSGSLRFALPRVQAQAQVQIAVLVEVAAAVSTDLLAGSGDDAAE